MNDDSSIKHDKILDKIAAALRIAESESKLNNLEAAENAASIAARLMLEHGISTEAVEARQNGTDKIGILPHVPGESGDKKYTRETPWVDKLAGIVAAAFNCRLLIPNTGVQKKYGYNCVIFVGYENERKLASHYYALLTAALGEAVDKEYRKNFHKAYRQGTHSLIAGTEWRKNFLIGALTGLIRRFEQMKAEVIIRSGSSSTALLRINQTLAKIDEHLADFKEVPSAPNILPKEKLNSNGLKAGYKWAEEMSLLAPLEAGSAAKVLPKR